MIERTEELGLSARLPIVVGGQQVELRTLNLEESETWQAKLAAAVAKYDLPESPDPATLFAAFVRQPTGVMLDLVLAYDLDKKLGTRAALRKRMNQRELYAAVKTMVSAEAPFLEDARSVVEAFGPQLRAIAASVLTTAAIQSQRGNSTSGPSPNGVSILTPSEVGSPSSGS